MITLLELADRVTVNTALPAASLYVTSTAVALIKPAKYPFNSAKSPEVAALPVTVPGTGLIDRTCPLKVNPI